jgi:hypothetical protein
MKYLIKGNRTSGEPASVAVIARDRAHAEDQATTLGITVTAIEQIPDSISEPIASQTNPQYRMLMGLAHALIARFL